MEKYLVTVIKPEGYAHSECLREVAETLQFGLRSLGHTAQILDNLVDPQATNIILGAHLLEPHEERLLPPGSIIYNLEQLGAARLSDNYYALAKRYQIWDYSPFNIERWNQIDCISLPRLVELGYVPELRRIASCPEQDIDVLFYGSMNDHRLSVLRKLRDVGIKVNVAFGVYGRERDDLIARSKIVLNIHCYETQLFEAVRVSYLLANSKAVVTEPSPDIGHYSDAVAVFSADDIVAGCLDLLKDDAKRKALEIRGFEHFSQRSAAQILDKVLPSRRRKERDPSDHSRQLRSLYLDMVQRCVINLIYEDPNQDYWSPHQFSPELRELGRDWPLQAHSMIGNQRMSNLRQITEFVIENRIPGDLMETGVWRGGACIMMRAVLQAYGVEDRRVWAADSFCGLPEPSPEVAADTGDRHHTFTELAVSLEKVRSNFSKYGLLDEQVQFLEGWFSETLPQAPIQSLAVLRLDGDMYQSTMDVLESLYDKVSQGGFVIVDDFGSVQGCRTAILDFRASRSITDPIHPIDGSGVFWRKLTPSSELRNQRPHGSNQE
jgi:Macrocin-O-methyltransferase (TylF)